MTFSFDYFVVFLLIEVLRSLVRLAYLRVFKVSS